MPSKIPEDRWIFLLDMDAFFASCEQRMSPRLRGRPIAVCGNPKKRSVVAACSYEAKAYGVHNGMSIHEAKRRCPALIPVPGHPDVYRSVARQIFLKLEQYTPAVEVVSIDEAYLDMTATAHHFLKGDWSASAWTALGRSIQRKILQEEGLPCTLGLGPNKMLAKLAASRSKPFGVGCVLPEQLPGVLSHVPAASIGGIGPRTAQALERLGIRTLGELHAFSEDFLTQHFGRIGPWLYGVARGYDTHPVKALEELKDIQSMSHMYTLEKNTRSSDVVTETLFYLCEKLAYRLRQGHWMARTIHLTLRAEDFATTTRQRSLPVAVNDANAIFETAESLQQQLVSVQQGKLDQWIRLVGVGASRLEPWSKQMELWEAHPKRDQLNQCLDQINNRYGKRTITHALAQKALTQKTKGLWGQRWISDDMIHD